MISSAIIDRFMQRYGNTVTLFATEDATGQTYRAFLQPLRYKNKMYLESVRTRIGYVDQSYFLYIGPADVDVTALTEEAVIQSGDLRFCITHAEAIRVADEPLYYWAVMRAWTEQAESDQEQPPEQAGSAGESEENA